MHSWIAFVFGSLLGSFLNVIAYRIPRFESIVSPRSHCTVCQRTLSAWELVPIVSWTLLRGRCRTCGTAISIRYPVIELSTGVLFAITALSVNGWWERGAWWLFWLVLMAAVGTDLTSMKVPNLITYPGVVVVAGAAILSGVHSWQQTLLGLLVGFLVLAALHWLSGGRMGMGDAKLYASIGAMLGVVSSIESLVLACVSGSVVGLCMRALGLLQIRQPIPFVPHIAIGVVITVVFGRQLTHWYVRSLLGW